MAMAMATAMRIFEPELVFGLLQTPDYARALFEANDRLTDDVVERRLRLRLERQQTVFSADPPPSIVVVLGEGALSLVVGSDAIMAEQVAHLLAIDERPNLDVRVRPSSAGPYVRRGSFVLFDFADDEDPSVAFVDVPTGARYFDREAERSEYEHVFAGIASRSISISEWAR